VGRVRATVRAGRDRMRNTLLSWLPQDLTGQRILDAGCGTGALAVEAARRGAHVVAIDLSPTLVNLARERLPTELVNASGWGSIDFRSGDMLDPALGEFDHVVAMDSLIHYRETDIVASLARQVLRQPRQQRVAHAVAAGAHGGAHAAHGGGGRQPGPGFGRGAVEIGLKFASACGVGACGHGDSSGFCA